MDAHYFFAVRIPEETKETLKTHMEKLKKILPFQRWVHDQDLHITLTFLGSASEDQLAAAIKNVTSALEGAAAFPIHLGRLGVFGRSDFPRVFWVDMEESNELQMIRDKVFLACEQAGFKLETRPFRPHITLARKWSGEVALGKQMLDVWRELQPKALSFQAEKVVLYQTHLDRTPKYEAVKVFPLQT